MGKPTERLAKQSLPPTVALQVGIPPYHTLSNGSSAVRGEGSETRPDRQQRDFRDSRENRQEFRAFPNKQRSDKARLVPRPLDTLGLAWGRILVKEEGTQDAREAGPRESRSRSSTGGYVGGGVHTGEGLFSGLCLVLRQGLWVALVIPELCTLGWSWTQKSSLLF